MTAQRIPLSGPRRTRRAPTAVRVLATVVAVIAGLAPGVAHADEPDPARCESIPFPLSGGGTLATTLCRPTGARADAVMVLMPGSNYNHTYWDFPYAPETYNFRRAMNAAGYATLVIDRLGTGASSRPSSTEVNATGDAQALHEIVGALRGGLAGTPAFDTVVTGGHSLSSGVAVLEATTHHDVDGVLLTGYSHGLNVPGALGVISTYQPADRDPAFAGRGYDTGYLTTRPGTRERSFHGAETSDPRVVAVDEATKDVFAATEYPDGLTSTLPPMSTDITAPVLVVNGSADVLCSSVCADTATLQAAETPHFSPAARLRTFVLPGSGHSVNLARNTGEYQAAVREWMASVTG
ncbi:alpha/beta fold hydrolase [Nocardia sp. NPDC019395]|uniref:alpha/beta hydrolase n=1 Tax=Nocardia sp. NPDC019395 TaxID=3154686 RepID=UPI0033DE1816